MLASVSHSNIHLSARYTKVHRTMTDIFLTQEQVEDLQIQIRGRKMMERVVLACSEKNICSRSVTYTAINPLTYDGENPLHRLAANEAITLLKQIGIKLPWAENLKVITA